MNRRSALGAALALPVLIQRAFAGDLHLGPDITFAMREAHAAGRPLAIIVVEPEEWERGSAWGQFFTCADDSTMARLGQCDWVCATPGAVKDALGVNGDAWLWIVVPGQAPMAGIPELPPKPGVPAEATKPALPPAIDALERVLAEAPACTVAAQEMARMVIEQVRAAGTEDLSIEADFMDFVAIAAAELRRTWTCAGPPPASLDELDAAVSKAAVVISYRGGDARRLADPALDAWVDARVAAMTAMVTRLIPAPPADPKLAERAVTSLRDAPPRGARWGFASGCGTSYGPAPGYPAEHPNFDCGMGHVNTKAVRFLDFLVK